ncbi:hypothetical protein ACP4OV_002342 [Aristida adscensionis]
MLSYIRTAMQDYEWSVVMDIAHQDYLLAALYRTLSVVTLLICLLTEVSILVSQRHAALHLVPLSAILLLHSFCRRDATTDIYLVDFSCLKPPRQQRAPIPAFLEHLKLMTGLFKDDGIEFMATAMAASGMGDETHLPPSLFYIPPDATHGNAVREARASLLPALDELFAKTGVPPSAVGAVVACCSGFCPAPSLAAIVAGHYRMRSDVRTFNISGMGCSAGVIGVDVARSLLTAAAVSYAVVVSTEVLTVGWYSGRDHSKLLLNCFFRTGCSAALVTNKRGGAHRTPAKYRLVRLVRTNKIADDGSYYSGYREEDDEGITGFNVGRGVGRAFEAALRAHLATLGVSVLPWRERLRYATAVLRRSLLRDHSPAAAPSFRTAAEHFCLPTTWGPMIRRLGRGLGLGETEMEAALMAFHRFGNQSAATLWYQLAYLEAKGMVRKGDRVWQLGVGTGMKVNSALWERVTADEDDDDGRTGAVGPRRRLGPWIDCIHRYPVSSG